jgi:PHD/YefM family antitoxin component YafN of YafNO toxin-antitoxin module
MTTTITSLEFDQDIDHAKKVAQDGPVIITDEGEPAHVLLSIEEYRRITGPRKTIIELLAMEGAEDCDDLEIPPRSDSYRPVELS